MWAGALGAMSSDRHQAGSWCQEPWQAAGVARTPIPGVPEPPGAFFRVREALVLVTLTTQAREGRYGYRTETPSPALPCLVPNHRAFAVQWVESQLCHLLAL